MYNVPEITEEEIDGAYIKLLESNLKSGSSLSTKERVSFNQGHLLLIFKALKGGVK